jgi:hypothetical protein
MEQSEFERPPAAGEAERPARRLAGPDAVVDHEIVAVEPAQAAHLAVAEIGEERLVELARRLAAAGRPGRPADDVVLGILVQRGEHPVDIVARLEAEMRVERGVHLFPGQSHFPPPIESR